MLKLGNKLKRIIATICSVGILSSFIPSNIAFATSGSQIGGRGPTSSATTIGSYKQGTYLSTLGFSICILDAEHAKPLDPGKGLDSQIVDYFSQNNPKLPDTGGRIYILPEWNFSNSKTNNAANANTKYIWEYWYQGVQYSYGERESSNRIWHLKSNYKNDNEEAAHSWMYKNTLLPWLTAVDENGEQKNKLSQLEGKWCSNRFSDVPNTTMTDEEAQRIFGYIFYDGPNNIKTRIEKFLKTDYDIKTDDNGDISIGGNNNGKIASEGELQARYLELLIACYKMGSYSNTVRAQMEAQIDSYCRMDAQTMKAPPFIEIEPVSTLFNIDGSGAGIAMSDIDVAEYYYGMTPTYNTRNWNSAYKNATGNTMELFRIAGSLAAKSGWYNGTRLSSNYTAGSGHNVFTGAIGMMTGFFPQTDATGFSSIRPRSNNTEDMESIWFTDSKRYGFGIMYNASLLASAPEEGRQDIYTNEPKTVQVPFESTTVGEDIPITLETKQDATVIKQWEDTRFYTDSNGNKQEYKYEITAKIEETVNGVKKQGPESLDGELFNNDGNTQEWEHTELTWTQLKDLYLKNKEYKYLDKAKDTPIGPNAGDEVLFEYRSEVYVRKLQQDGTIYINPAGSYMSDQAMQIDKYGWVRLNPDDGYDYKKFTKQEMKPHYKSVPQAYSEIKNFDHTEGNDNYLEPKEAFEAMAGTPTTRSLYFASGGSEFVVDVNFDYVTETATRDYKIKFTDDLKNCNLYHTKSHVGHYETDDDGDRHWVHDRSKCKNTKHTPCNNECTLSSFTRSWSQSIDIEYMKITSCKVWRIEESKVNGMKELVPIAEDDDTIEMSIQDHTDESMPGVSFFVATDTSVEGNRLRYSFMPNGKEGYDDEHVTSNSKPDSIEWEYLLTESPSPHCWDTINSWANNIEQTHRSQQNQAFVQSDYLVLRTTSGDQQVFYWDDMTDVNSLDKTLKVNKQGLDGMWKNNTETSASKWSSTEINTCYYNGKYSTPEAKFQTSGNEKKFTVIDKGSTFRAKYNGNGTVLQQFENVMGDNWSTPMKKDLSTTGAYLYTTSPDNKLWFFTGFDPNITYPNGEYETGTSSIRYVNLINYGGVTSEYDKGYFDPSNSGWTLDKEAKYITGENDLIVHSTYSSEHEKVNNIVIHNPVSTEKSLVISLPEERDQRIPNSKALGKSIIEAYNESISDTIEEVNPNFHNNLLFNGDAEIINFLETRPLGWSSLNVENAEYTYAKTSALNGKYSFEIVSQEDAYYYQDIPVNVGDTYVLSGKIKTKAGNGRVRLVCLNSAGNAVTEGSKTSTSNGTINMEIVIPERTVTLRVMLMANDTSQVLFDDLDLYNKSKSGFIANTMKVYDWITTKNENYNENAVDALETKKYEVSSETEHYVVEADGYYSIEAYGGDGGDIHVNGIDQANGGLGAYVSGKVYLNKGDTISVTIGHAGQNADKSIQIEQTPDATMNTDQAFGYHNGGFGTDYAGAGGGSTGIEINGVLYIEAAGGGGASQRASGNNAPSEDENTWSYKEGESTSLDNPTQGAGGGGFTGGKASSSEDKGGYGGTNFRHEDLLDIDKSIANRNASGQGKVVISYSPRGNENLKEITTWTLSNSQPNNSIYIVNKDGEEEYVKDGRGEAAFIKKSNSSGVNQPVSDDSSDAFINLDYGFSIYLPNVGDFEQSSTMHGISDVTDVRGMGFIDDMDTTEWTASKYVVFPFNVIHKGVMYTTGEKVYLDVNEEYFDFYCPLGNTEAVKAEVKFYAIAVNNKGIYRELGTSSEIMGNRDMMNSADFKEATVPANDTGTKTGFVRSNCIGLEQEDNKKPINRNRYTNYAAKHSAVKSYFIDVVGRIGNFMIEDTGDPRFANFFKKTDLSKEWLEANVIPAVDESKQNNIVGHVVDIRDVPIHVTDDTLNWTGERKKDDIETLLGVSDSKIYKNQNGSDKMYSGLNTYGNSNLKMDETKQEHEGITPYNFPLTPSINNISVLRNQPIRFGYPVYQDIQTIGDYGEGHLEIIPFYYRLKLDSTNSKTVDNPEIEPVDIYMNKNGSYVPINIFNAINEKDKANNVDVGETHKDKNKIFIYDNKIGLDWTNENVRRNCAINGNAYALPVSEEWTITSRIAYDEGVSKEEGIQIPRDSYYNIGNNNLIVLNGRTRTFMGSTKTYGYDMNPGDKVPEILYQLQGQRWHFTNFIPSSSVILTHGKRPTSANINASKNDNNSVILVAYDIKAVGQYFTLQNDPAGAFKEELENNKKYVNVNGKKYNISKINDFQEENPRVTVIMSNNKSASNDMTTTGTH